MLPAKILLAALLTVGLLAGCVSPAAFPATPTPTTNTTNTTNATAPTSTFASGFPSTQGEAP